MNAATHNFNPEIIATLIKAGADVNARTEYGSTVLMEVATFNSNPEAIKALVKAGSDVKATDKNGQTVLDRMKKNLKLYKTDAYWEVNDKM